MPIGFTNIGTYGRLGNQMFQYAALRGIANQKRYKWILRNQDSELFKCFEMKEARASIGQFNFSSVFHPSENMTNIFDQSIYEHCEDNTDLFGYFQSPKYFRDIESTIRKEFTFIQKDNPFKIKRYLSLHVRRGDYLKIERFLPTQTTEYYQNALKYFDPKMPVIVCSDDINWCKENEFFQKERFIFSTNNTYDDMLTMSQASGNIISNSSYSWWGAYLSRNKDVVIPKNWFGPKRPHHSAIEYLQDGWKIC